MGILLLAYAKGLGAPGVSAEKKETFISPWGFRNGALLSQIQQE